MDKKDDAIRLALSGETYDPDTEEALAPVREALGQEAEDADEAPA